MASSGLFLEELEPASEPSPADRWPALAAGAGAPAVVRGMLVLQASRVRQARETERRMSASLAAKDLEVQAAKALATAAVAEAKKRWSAEQAGPKVQAEIKALTKANQALKAELQAAREQTRGAVRPLLAELEGGAMEVCVEVAAQLQHSALGRQQAEAQTTSVMLQQQADQEAQKQLTTELDEQKAHAAQLESELEELKAHAAQLETALGSVQRTDRSQFEAERREFELQINELCGEVADLKAQKLELEQMAAASEEASRQAEDELAAQWQAERQAAQEKIEQLCDELVQLREDPATPSGSDEGGWVDTGLPGSSPVWTPSKSQSRSTLLASRLDGMWQSPQRKSREELLEEKVAELSKELAGLEKQLDEQSAVAAGHPGSRVKELTAKVASLEAQNRALAEGRDEAARTATAGFFRGSVQSAEGGSAPSQEGTAGFFRGTKSQAPEESSQWDADLWDAERQELLAQIEDGHKLQEAVAVQWHAERQGFEAQIHQLTGQIADEKAKSSSGNELTAEVSVLLTAKAEAEATIRELEGQLADSSEKAGQCVHSESKAARLETELAMMRGEVRGASEARKAMQQSAEQRWQAERKSLQLKLEQLSKELAESRAAADELQRLRPELDDVTNQLLEAQKAEQQELMKERSYTLLREDLAATRAQLTKLAAATKATAPAAVIKMISDGSLASKISIQQTEIGELTNQLKEAEQACQNVQVERELEVARLKDQLTESVQSHAAQLRHAERPQLTIGSQLEKWTSNAQLLREANDLRSEKADRAGSVNLSSEELFQLRKQIIEATTLNEDLEEENESLREQLDAQSSRRNKIHNIEKTLKELQTQLESEIEENKRLRSELQEVTASRDRDRARLHVFEGHKRAIEVRQKRLESMSAQLEVTSESVWGELGSGLMDFIERHRNECSAQHNEIVALIEENNLIVAQQEEREASYRAELDMLRQRPAEDNTDKAALLAEKAVTDQRLQAAQGELSTQAHVTDALEQQHTRMLQAFERQLTQFQSSITSLANAGLSPSSRGSSPISVNLEITSSGEASESVQVVQLLQSTLSAASSVIEELSSRLARSEAGLKNEMLATLEVAQEAEQTREALKTQQREAMESSRGAKEESAALRKELKQREIEIETLVEERADNAERMHQLDATIARGSAEVEELRVQLAGQLGEDSQLMEVFTRQISVLQEELKEKDRVALETQALLSAARSELRETKQGSRAVSELQMQIEKLERVVLQQEEAKAEVESNFDMACRDRVRLQQKVDQLAETIDSMEVSEKRLVGMLHRMEQELHKSSDPASDRLVDRVAPTGLLAGQPAYSKDVLLPKLRAEWATASPDRPTVAPLAYTESALSFKDDFSSATTRQQPEGLREPWRP